MIDDSSKSISIETDTESLTNGENPDVNQKAIESTVAVNMTCLKDNIGLALISTLIDLLYDKSTSKEYSITFIYGATTIFRAVLHSFSVDEVAGTNKATIKIELSRGLKNPTKPNGVPTVAASTGTLPGG